MLAVERLRHQPSDHGAQARVAMGLSAVAYMPLDTEIVVLDEGGGRQAERGGDEPLP
jgi:hypothetical protein